MSWHNRGGTQVTPTSFTYTDTTHCTTDRSQDIRNLVRLSHYSVFYKDAAISGFQNISYKVNLPLWIGPVKTMIAKERHSPRESAMQLTHEAGQSDYFCKRYSSLAFTNYLSLQESSGNLPHLENSRSHCSVKWDHFAPSRKKNAWSIPLDHKVIETGTASIWLLSYPWQLGTQWIYTELIN